MKNLQKTQKQKRAKLSRRKKRKLNVNAKQREN